MTPLDSAPLTVVLPTLPPPRGALIALAHGAGGSQADPLLVAACASLEALGHGTVRFDFAYRRAGKRLPPRAPPLLEEWRDVVARAAALAPAHPLVIGGKSMGGRLASMLAASAPELPVRALLLLSYPLHPALRAGERPTALRVEHLPAIAVPMLFVSGDKDPLCRLARLRPVLRKLGRGATLEVVRGGDHDLSTGRRAPPPDVGALFQAWWRDGARGRPGRARGELVG